MSLGDPSDGSAKDEELIVPSNGGLSQAGRRFLIDAETHSEVTQHISGVDRANRHHWRSQRGMRTGDGKKATVLFYSSLRLLTSAVS
jgi:hypothetical protein